MRFIIILLCCLVYIFVDVDRWINDQTVKVQQCYDVWVSDILLDDIVIVIFFVQFYPILTLLCLSHHVNDADLEFIFTLNPYKNHKTINL